MKNIHKLFKILLLSLLILYINKVKSEKTSIKILIYKPNIEIDNYLERYNEVTNNYISQNKNNLNLPEIEFEFSYFVQNQNENESISKYYEENDSPFLIDNEIAKNLNSTINALKNSEYDMMILDDRELYGDESYIKNTKLFDLFKYRYLKDFLINFDDYLKRSDLSFHDNEILDDAILPEEGLYGLPYEFDFDVEYYNPVNEDSSYTSNQEPTHKGPKAAGLGNNDQLLNDFTEHVCRLYGIPNQEEDKKAKTSYYDLYYDSRSNELYEKYNEYIKNDIGTDYEKVLNESSMEAYESFIKGEKLNYSGKASYYHSLRNKIENMVILNDDSRKCSVVNEKFLVINKNSLNDKKTLVNIAQVLTSKEMQLYRAEQLGTIPTLNFESDDKDALTYCENNPEICEKIKNLTAIHIKKMFYKEKSNFSASFMETRMVIPLNLKKSLLENNTEYIMNAFLNIIDLQLEQMAQNFMTLYPFIAISTLLSVIATLSFISLIIVVFIKRKHPYMKAISPSLSILMLIGMCIKYQYPMFYLMIKSVGVCRMSYVLGIVINFLIELPMLANVYRIYCIYTNKTNASLGRKLKDYRLLLYIFIIILIVFGITLSTSYFNEFLLITNGTLQKERMFACNYEKNTAYFWGTNVFYLVVFCLMLYMTIQIHRSSKKYGEISFMFFIIILLFSSFICDLGIQYLMDFKGTIQFLLSVIGYVACCNFCAYYLVGNRLFYIKKHEKDHSSIYDRKDYFNHSAQLIDYIALKKNGEYLSFNTTIGTKSHINTFSKTSTIVEENGNTNNN